MSTCCWILIAIPILLLLVSCGFICYIMLATARKKLWIISNMTNGRKNNKCIHGIDVIATCSKCTAERE